MLQVPYDDVGEVESEDDDVGKVQSLDYAYRSEKNQHAWTKRQLRRARAEKNSADQRAKKCEAMEAQKARFFDRRLLHPVVSVPADPWAIAMLLAMLIAIDRRTGFARRPIPSLKFERDKGVDLFAGPTEVNTAKVGDCAKFVRQEGAYRGTAVGCARVPGGFHVWLKGANGEIIDVCVDRGMPRPPATVYASGVYADIPREPRFVPRDVADDAFEMQETLSLPLDQEAAWPVLGDADLDIFGVEDDLVEDADVYGTATTAAQVVGVVGAIGAVLATAYGGPAAGGVVQVVAQTTAGAIASMEKKAPPKPSPRVPQKNDAAPINNIANQVVKRAETAEDRRVAAALAVVTSENEEIVKALKNRLKTPREKDSNPEFRMALEAAVVGLQMQGYDLPMRRLRFPAEMVELAHVSGVDDVLKNYLPDCWSCSAT